MPSFADAIRAHRQLPPQDRVVRLNVPYASEIATLVINLPCEGIKTVLKHLIPRDVGQAHKFNVVEIDLLKWADGSESDDAGEIDLLESVGESEFDEAGMVPCGL